MSRMVSVARFGLADTDRVRAELATAGLDPAVEADRRVLRYVGRAGSPDLALSQYARLVEAEGPALGQAVMADDHLLAALTALLGGSGPLGDHLISHPGQYQILAQQQLPDKAGCYTALAEAVGLDPAAPPATGNSVTGVRQHAVSALRVAYRSLLAHIAGLDLSGLLGAAPARSAELIARALTDAADALLSVSLAVAAAELGPRAAAARLAVIAMGKCGGQELNYLSDVDVMYLAAPEQPGTDEDAALATASALASAQMRICQQVAWTVDANLRPEGAAGALVRTMDGMRSYYQKWAHTWEFQALLKARPAAGDLVLGQQFCQLVAPWVWSAAGRDSFVDDVQAMRRRVESLIPAAHAGRELKLGAGGLRDIEFAVQLMQLVHGRTDEALRSAGTLPALRALRDGGYVSRPDGAELEQAYTFLRSVEHRIQLSRLRRTHLLPTEPAALEQLARTMGMPASGAASAAEVLSAELTRQLGVVRELHEKLFYRPLLHAVAAVSPEELRLTTDAATARLAALGFTASDAALRHIAALTNGVNRAAAIQRTLLPVLLEVLATGPDPDHGLLAYRQISEALQHTWYLGYLRDNSMAANRLAHLLGTSRLVADLLVRSVDVVQLLGSERGLVAAEPTHIASALLARCSRADSAAAAAQQARAAFSQEMLRLVCADLLGMADLSMVMTALTGIVTASVQGVFAAAWAEVSAQRGPIPARLSVIGMGRFGGAELGYGSDADVMYVARVDDGADEDAALASCRAVADLIGRSLGRASADRPIDIDVDLRPEGRNGPLVRTLDSYRRYWASFASTWERQAMLRAAYVAGDQQLGEDFLAAAADFRYPPGGVLPAQQLEIVRMKRRVETERLPRGADPTTHTKLGRGGISDTEWTIQLLQLKYAHRVPELQVTGTLAAISAAAQAGVLDNADATALREGWVLASTVRNALVAVRGKAEDQLPQAGRGLAALARALGYSAGVDPGQFVDDYRRVTRRARRVYVKYFGGQ